MFITTYKRERLTNTFRKRRRGHEWNNLKTSPQSLWSTHQLITDKGQSSRALEWNCRINPQSTMRQRLSQWEVKSAITQKVIQANPQKKPHPALLKGYWRSTRTHRHITPQTSVTQITMKQTCSAHSPPREQLKERATAKISTCASSSHPHLGNHSYVWRKLKVQKLWRTALQAIEHNDETTYDETWPFSAYAHLGNDRIRMSKQKPTAIPTVA